MGRDDYKKAKKDKGKGKGKATDPVYEEEEEQYTEGQYDIGGSNYGTNQAQSVPYAGSWTQQQQDNYEANEDQEITLEGGNSAFSGFGITGMPRSQTQPATGAHDPYATGAYNPPIGAGEVYPTTTAQEDNYIITNGFNNLNLESSTIPYMSGEIQSNWNQAANPGYARAVGGAPSYYGNNYQSQGNLFASSHAYPQPTFSLPSSRGNTNYRIQRQNHEKDKYQRALHKNEYRVYHSNFFNIGDVVKVFWFEPRGGNGKSAGGDDTQTRNETALEKAGLPGKPRRFIITQKFDGHCIGIPINTYGYRGTTKPGCHPHVHSMIYTCPKGTNDAPNYLAGETILPNPKIRMVQTTPEELVPQSRINYAKQYTIEHNFKVRFIGRIAKASSEDFWATFNRIHAAAQARPEPLEDSFLAYDQDTANLAPIREERSSSGRHQSSNTHRRSHDQGSSSRQHRKKD